MSGPKAAFLLLALLALLLVAGLGLGAGRRGAAGQPWWTTTLDAWLGSDAAVLPREISSGCFQDGRFAIPAGRSCVAAIRATERARVRYLTLGLGPGTAAAEVRVTPRDRDLAGAMDVRLRAGMAKLPRLPVLAGGAELELTCRSQIPSAPACHVELR